MKRIVLVTLAVALMAGSAFGQGFGVRAGVSIDPDQFHFGGHYDVGAIATNLRLVPNIEIGLGNDVTLICLNGDLLYDFPDTPWSVGGELGVNIAKFDVPDVPGIDIDDSDTNIGLSAVGDYRLTLNSGKTLLLEAKLGISDSPDFKFTVGWKF